MLTGGMGFAFSFSVVLFDITKSVHSCVINGRNMSLNRDMYAWVAGSSFAFFCTDNDSITHAFPDAESRVLLLKYSRVRYKE